MLRENPFTPSFGEVPFCLAGRDDVIRDMESALNRKRRSPELTTLFSGARGTGKTALLTHLAEIAQQHGWVSAEVTCAPGMLEDIFVQATRAAKHIVGPTDAPRITRLGIGGMFDIAWDSAKEEPSNWRLAMEDLIGALDEHGIGLLITVDEVDPSVDEMRHLAQVYQHFVRSHRRVGLILAGLPYNLMGLKREKSITFLRRSEAHLLGRIPDSEAREAFRRTAESGGRAIADEALDIAVQASNGFAFMIQLVGYRMWDISPDEPTISPDDARRGAELAQAELQSRIFDPTYRDLSDGDIAFLEAMLQESGEVPMTSIQEHMGKSSAYVNTYKRRLLAQGIIGERGRTRVDFDLPGFREYLVEAIAAEHATS